MTIMISLIKSNRNAMKIQKNQILKSRQPRKELLNYKEKLTSRPQLKMKRKNKEKIRMNSKTCWKKRQSIQIAERDSETKNGLKLKKNMTRLHMSFKRPRKLSLPLCQNPDSSKRKLTQYLLKFLNTSPHTPRNKNSNKNHGTEFSIYQLKFWLMLQSRLIKIQLRKFQISATIF